MVSGDSAFIAKFLMDSVRNCDTIFSAKEFYIQNKPRLFNPDFIAEVKKGRIGYTAYVDTNYATMHFQSTRLNLVNFSIELKFSTSGKVYNYKRTVIPVIRHARSGNTIQETIFQKLTRS